MKIEEMNNSMKTENLKLKIYINDFNFPDPEWAGASADILKLSKKGLSKQEGHLLDGIKLAWLTSEGRDFLYKKVARGIFVSATVIVLTLIGYGLIAKTEESFTKTVSAKTVVGDFVEATMSAVFRK